MTNQIIENFFEQFFKEVKLAYNPLIENSSSFIKFRSDYTIKDLTDHIDGIIDDTTELSFHILPYIENISFDNIERLLSNILLTNDYVRLELMEMDFIIDLSFKKLSEYEYPAIWVRIFFIGEIVNMSFISHVNAKLSESNKFISTDNGWWKKRKTSALYNILSTRETDPIDFFNYKSDYLFRHHSVSEIYNLTLLNYYVPHHFSLIDIHNNNTISLFKDITLGVSGSNNNKDTMNNGFGDVPF